MHNQVEVSDFKILHEAGARFVRFHVRSKVKQGATRYATYEASHGGNETFALALLLASVCNLNMCARERFFFFFGFCC